MAGVLATSHIRSKAKRICKVLERITYDELPKVRSEGIIWTAV